MSSLLFFSLRLNLEEDITKLLPESEETGEIEKEFHRVKKWSAEAEEIKKEKLQEIIAIGDVDIIEVEVSPTDANIINAPEAVSIDQALATVTVLDIQALKPACRDYIVGGAVGYSIAIPSHTITPIPEGDTTTVAEEEKINTHSEEGLQFELFPNPSSDKLNVKSIGAPVSNYRIIDMTGKLVLEGKSAKELLQIDISGLENGNYLFIRFKDASALVSKQFIVAH